MSQPAPTSELHIRRVRRADLPDIMDLLESVGRSITVDRAVARRFRNIVGDLGCDFDVAVARERVCGFVHIAYVRDLHVGNRAHLLALIGATSEICDTLLARAVQRAVRRRCRDVTVASSAWIAIDCLSFSDDWQMPNGCRRLDLEPDGQGPVGDLPGDNQTCRG